MQLYRYIGDDDRHYHDIGTVKNGNKHELPEDPGDGRWELIETTDKRVETSSNEEPKK